jgi:hypothetical protein
MYQDLGLARCFWVCAGICFLESPFLWLRLPETKGQTLQEIERALVD